MLLKDKITICVFAKPPVAGTVKTRLMHTYGKNHATNLAIAFLQDTLANLRRLKWAEIVIATTFPHGTQMKSLAAGLEIIDQGNGDLGARIERVMRLLLKRTPAVFAMGADTPGLPLERLNRARTLIDTHDSVIGPAVDGGFYLLGLKRCPAGLLSNLPWGTSDTFARTVDRIQTEGFSIATMKSWFDVDRPDDVRTLLDLIHRQVVIAPASERTINNLALIENS